MIWFVRWLCVSQCGEEHVVVAKVMGPEPIARVRSDLTRDSDPNY